MVNAGSGRIALISVQPFEVYDDGIVTLMRKVIRPGKSSYLEEARFDRSGWEPVKRDTFARLWDDEADGLPKTTTKRLYLLTGLLIPIWQRIPTHNERIYRVTPDGCGSMIGRTVTEEGAAALRATFMAHDPKLPADIVGAVMGSSQPVDLGQGLKLTRRRVAGEARLEITGADKDTITHLKSLGCFTEIIAFHLRVFVPAGEQAENVVARILGEGTEANVGTVAAA